MIINDCVLDLENSMDLEPDAATWIDQSRYKNHGTITAGAGGWVQLPSGLWVYDFDGAASVIALGLPNSLKNITYPFTVSFWANTDLSTCVYITMSGNHIADTAIALAAGANIYLGSGGVNRWGVTNGSALLQSGVWEQWVVVYTLETSVKFYLNAISRTVVNILDTFASIGWIVGARDLVGSQTVNGQIGSPEVYRYALTAGQVRNNYEKTKHLYGVA